MSVDKTKIKVKALQNVFRDIRTYKNMKIYTPYYNIDQMKLFDLYERNSRVTDPLAAKAIFLRKDMLPEIKVCLLRKYYNLVIKFKKHL